MNDKLEELREQFRKNVSNQQQLSDLRSVPPRGQSQVVALRVRFEDFNQVAARADAMALTPAEWIRYAIRRALREEPAGGTPPTAGH